jgi:hypothetical protein
MAIVETRAEANHKYFMRKKKADIILHIDMLRTQILGLEPLDKRKILYWDKWSLASEAVRTHRMLPPETNNA